MFKPKQRSLKRTMAMAVLNGALVAGATGGSLVAFSAITPEVAIAPGVPSPGAVQPVVPDRPQALMDEHDCWSGAAPKDMKGVVPGHVVTNRGLGGTRMVGKALEQVFGAKDHGLVVYGFCR